MRAKLQGRELPLRMPPDWEPPYPSFESHYHEEACAVSLAIFGVQFDEAQQQSARELAAAIRLLARDQHLDHVDWAHCPADSAGRQQIIVSVYCLQQAALDAFVQSDAVAQLWARHSATGLPYGVFRELFNVPMARFESLHSGPDHQVGLAHARSSVSDPIPAHAYWGSMRDRLPGAASERFEPGGAVEVLESGPARVRLRAGDNLAMIRSGQDLGRARGAERAEYFGDVEPVLQRGMDFLRDQGREVNCHDCRFMRYLGEDGEPLDHTFGLAYFANLSDLEDWAEHHPTHLAIFNAFLQYAPRYGEAMQSRYWHEVSVLPAGEHWAEYVNCAPGTGLMAALEP